MKNSSVQSAIEDASSYLRSHRQRRLIVYLSAGLSVVLLLVVLLSFASILLSLVFAAIALPLMVVALTRLGLLSGVKQHDALQLLDSHLELKERFITLEKLEKEILERPQYVTDPRVEYIKSELAPRVVNFNSKELPRELTRNQKILLLFGIVFFALSLIMLPFSGFFPIEQVGARQIKAIEDLLRDGSLPEQVQDTLREVLQKIKEDGLTSDSVTEAIARAEQAIDTAEQQTKEHSQIAEDMQEQSPTPTPTPPPAEEEESEQEADEQEEQADDSGTFPQDQSSEQQEGEQEEEQEGDQEESDAQGEGEGESQEGDGAGESQSSSDQEGEDGQEPGEGEDEGDGESTGESEGESDQQDPEGQEGEAEGESDGLAGAKQALEDLKQEQESQQQEQEGQDSGTEPSPEQDDGSAPDSEQERPESEGDPEQAKQEEEAGEEEQQESEDRSADPTSIEESEIPGDQSDGGGASLPEPGEEATWEPGDEIADGLPDAQFEEKVIGDMNEIIDPRFGVDTGEVVEHQGEQDPRTALDDVELTRPEPGKDSSKQPIPLEYRDLIR